MRSASIPSIAALAAALVAIVLAVVAIADSGGGSTDDLEQRIAEVESAHAGIETGIATAQVNAAMNTIDGTGFHQIDENMQVATEIPAGVDGDILIARQVASAFVWPDELKEKADALVAEITAFEAVLEADDLQGAKTASAETHAAWHELHEAAYPYLAGEQPAADGDHEPMSYSSGDHAE